MKRVQKAIWIGVTVLQTYGLIVWLQDPVNFDAVNTSIFMLVPLIYSNIYISLYFCWGNDGKHNGMKRADDSKNNETPKMVSSATILMITAVFGTIAAIMNYTTTKPVYRRSNPFAMEVTYLLLGRFLLHVRSVHDTTRNKKE